MAGNSFHSPSFYYFVWLRYSTLLLLLLLLFSNALRFECALSSLHIHRILERNDRITIYAMNMTEQFPHEIYLNTAYNIFLLWCVRAFFLFFGLLAFFWPSDYTCDELEKYNVVCFLLLFSSLESFNELRSSIGYLVEQIRDNWLDYFSNDAIHLSFSVTKSIHKFEIRRKSSLHTQSQYLNRQISGILPELRLKTRTHTHTLAWSVLLCPLMEDESEQCESKKTTQKIQ